MPEEVRREVRRLLRHYPDATHVEDAAVGWPDTWAMKWARPAGAPSYLELLVRLRGQGMEER